MTDIVEELRSVPFSVQEGVCHRAADEIYRLRELIDLREGQRQQLVREIERLREANQAQTNVSRALQAEIEQLRGQVSELEESVEYWRRKEDQSYWEGRGD